MAGHCERQSPQLLRGDAARAARDQTHSYREVPNFADALYAMPLAAGPDRPAGMVFLRVFDERRYRSCYTGKGVAGGTGRAIARCSNLIQKKPLSARVDQH